MKVAIEARALHSTTSAGVKTYVSELIQNLREIGGVEYDVIDETVPAWKLPWWLNVTLPFKIWNINPDVVHYTKSSVPFDFAQGEPTVVTIYDVIPILFPESQAWSRRWLWPMILRRAALRSDHIMTISEASKRDIVKQFNVSPEKIAVTPLAVDLQRFQPRAGKTPEALNPYILFVGTRDMRKNIPLLIRAFARIAEDIPHQLVIAGRSALGRDDDKRQAQGLGSRVRWLDFVPEQELPALYAGADLFVWPSVYEGWGLPPMEAMASGVPVIVSDGGALPEVVGDTGEVVQFTTASLHERLHDEAFEAALAERMRAVLSDTDKQVRMREAGLARVQQFSWRRVAEQTLEVYRKVMRNE